MSINSLFYAGLLKWSHPSLSLTDPLSLEEVNKISLIALYFEMFGFLVVANFLTWITWDLLQLTESLFELSIIGILIIMAFGSLARCVYLSTPYGKKRFLDNTWVRKGEILEEVLEYISKDSPFHQYMCALNDQDPRRELSCFEFRLYQNAYRKSIIRKKKEKAKQEERQRIKDQYDSLYNRDKFRI